MSTSYINYIDIFEDVSAYLQTYETDLDTFVNDKQSKQYDEFMNNLYNNYTTIFTDIYNTNTKNMTVKKKIDYLEEKIHKIVICFKLRNINKFQRRLLEIKKDVYLNFLEDKIDSIEQEQSDNQFYPEITDNNFNEKIYYKKEFNKNAIPSKKPKKYSDDFVLTPTQKLLKNYISRDTPYNGILIWHGVGVGKTCTAISIAENFKKDMEKINKKILILTPGETLSGTWRNEIFNIEKELGKSGKKRSLNLQCTGTYYTKQYNSLSKYKNKKRMMKKFINNIYEISTYLKQVNIIKKAAQNMKSDIYKTYDQKEIAVIKKRYSNRIIIMDEVHMIKVETTTQGKIKTVPPYLEMIARHSQNTKIILLTATPVFNESSEVIQLINLLLWNDKRAPIMSQDIFKKKKKDFVLKSSAKEVLIKKTRGYISYLRGSNPHSFPTRLYPVDNFTYSPNWSSGNLVLYRHDIEEGSIQSDAYKIAIEGDSKGNFGKKGLHESLFALNHGQLGYTSKQVKIININKKDMYLVQKKIKGLKHEQFSYNNKNPDVISNGISFLNIDRLSNFSSKYANLLALIANADGTVFVYSDKVKVGVKLFSMILEENGMTRYTGTSGGYSNFLSQKHSNKNFFDNKYKYIYVDGSTENNVVNQWFEDYNTNKVTNIKVILGSDKVSQGINLFRIREVHILNPWFNLNKLEQVIGRATRQKSHKELPLKKQNVTVFLHTSYSNEVENENASADERNYRISYNKKINELKLLSIIKSNAIDCNLNKYGNFFKTINDNVIDAQGNRYEIKKGQSCDILDMNHRCSNKYLV